jgi:hypothetical protein
MSKSISEMTFAEKRRFVEARKNNEGWQGYRKNMKHAMRLYKLYKTSSYTSDGITTNIVTPPWYLQKDFDPR